ncbi:MAG: T9SS type A sorting domain-containing protein [Chitinophagaceae bacterium]|nr:T9SS type A sorting domain-containing protein [Chitinophagaceae bacterium]
MRKFTFRIIMVLICSAITINEARAQISSMPFVASQDTFTSIGGITLDNYGADDVIYGNLPIGFTFNYAGTAYTTFTASTNGFIEMGPTSMAFLYYNPLNGSRNNIIAPFGADLKNNSTTASLKYVTAGVAPNRVLIVQWEHYSYFGGNGDLNLQIWLYESSDCIRFVYGNNVIASTPLMTQIGLRGASNADYIALGDTSCNWALAAPGSSITTTFPVSLSCNMPSGFAFHFGPCPNQNGVTFSYINGKVFNDLNANGVYEVGEPGIPNRILQMTPGNYYLSSDASGNYAFFFTDSSLTYTISKSPMLYWNLTTAANTTVHPLTQACNNQNIGYVMEPNIHEVEINAYTWGAVPGDTSIVYATYENNGTSIESDTITFQMDPLSSYVSATPAPVSVNGQEVKWAYSNLAPGQTGSIQVHTLTSASAVLGNYLNAYWKIAPLNDTIPTNNIDSLHTLIAASFDPNEKLVEPVGNIETGDNLTYTIHFQNTGNLAANMVVIRDTIDANVDAMSFEVLGSSHPMTWNMNGNKIVTFTFNNINLPDSGSNMAGSHGHVMYKVNSATGLMPGTQIHNRAGIYFDNNLPIITNTTTNTIAIIIPEGIGEVKENTFILYPNPTNQAVYVQLAPGVSTPVALRIVTLDGRTVLQTTLTQANQQLDLKTLASGTYLCEMNSAKGKQVVKVVKE